MRSAFLRLNWRDLIKGLITAFFTAFITSVYELLTSGVELNWLTIKPIVFTSIAAMLGYLIKNFFTNSEGNLFKPETKKLD